MTIEEGSGNILDRIVERYQEQNIKIALHNEAPPSKGDALSLFLYIYVVYQAAIVVIRLL